ncbi:MAG: M43 family zinc metalloprotease [Crocinitomix sp.]|nr:M43 family zinc metalloprotease [Crocinitomix sp.]
MKNFIVTSLFIFAVGALNAQVEPWCGTDQYNESIFAANPDLRLQMHEHLSRVTSGAFASEERDGECIIPVVVHIIHDNGEGNIRHEQVLSGIQMLNEDFNRTNADADDTRDTDTAPFLDQASNMGIRFELAKIDPDGECTNGIQRRYAGSRSYNAGNGMKHYSSGGLDAWNRNYYFNIWIVNSINSDGAGTILGYAEFPYGGGSSNYGVIIRNDYFGSTGTASGDRTLTHEVGHCLGLLHTFQGGCHSDACDDNGDYCCDTPPVSEAQWSCSTTQNTCDEVPSGDLYGFDAKDQFENYMSYSPCQNMYSEDQKTIVLGNLAGIGFLENLVDPDHHDLTGVGLPAVLCKAQFMSGPTVICAGSTIQYTDDSYANVTEWNWTFEGGTPSTSTEENPLVTYDVSGEYSVELEVTDGVGTVSIVKEDYVVILSLSGNTLPYSEGFETIGMIPDNITILTVDEDGEDWWEVTDEAAYSGTHCAFLDNRGNDNRTKDEIISATFDLSDVDPDDDIIFSFKYAYVRRNASNDEWLRFYISNNCGETWTLRKNLHGDDLGEEIQNSSYTPESKDEWYNVNVTNINPDYYTAGFRFKIQFENDNGNNIYIDDINMSTSAMVGIGENEVQSLDLTVYPNPANDLLNVTMNLEVQTEVNVTLLNALGQEVGTVFNGELAMGNNNFSYDVSHLPQGVYFIRSVSANGITETTRFVKS